MTDSKLDPNARNQGIGFRIGDAFPADNPIARWTTVLSMASNDAIYLNIRLIEGDLPPALSIYYYRLMVGHFYEIATWLKQSRATWPEIEGFLTSLDAKYQERYERIVSFVDQTHPVYEQIKRSRHTLFHYPVMHPEREAAGVEELANAMEEAAGLPGWIEAADDYGSFRAAFADEIAMQFIADGEASIEQLMDELRMPIFELVELTEGALLAYLQNLPLDKTVVWRKGDPRPEVPEREDQNKQ